MSTPTEDEWYQRAISFLRENGNKYPEPMSGGGLIAPPTELAERFRAERNENTAGIYETPSSSVTLDPNADYGRLNLTDEQKREFAGYSPEHRNFLQNLAEQRDARSENGRQPAPATSVNPVNQELKDRILDAYVDVMRMIDPSIRADNFEDLGQELLERRENGTLDRQVEKAFMELKLGGLVAQDIQAAVREGRYDDNVRQTAVEQLEGITFFNNGHGQPMHIEDVISPASAEESARSPENVSQIKAGDQLLNELPPNALGELEKIRNANKGLPSEEVSPEEPHPACNAGLGAIRSPVARCP